MPDVGVSPDMFIPPYPLHFLTIIRYVSLLLLIAIALSPNEGGTTFLIMTGLSAVLIVADVYSGAFIPNRFVVFLIRVLAVVVPILMAGTGPDKNTRGLAGMTGALGIPAIIVMLAVPWIDPAI